MAEQLPSSGPPSDSPPARLDSWKDIAAHLKRDVSTVQRWEKREGMPVHRHVHDRQGSVYASRAELDAWMHGRKLPAEQDSGISIASVQQSSPEAGSPAVTSRRARVASRQVWVFVLAAAALLAVGTFWLQRT